MKRVFVDTSGFVAHLVAADAFHSTATPIFQEAARSSWELVTTNAVVFEAYTFLRKHTRNGRELALRFLTVIEEGLCTLVRVEPNDEARAVAVLRSHDDKEYSFCDALSFVVMERIGVEEAIAFDRDFRSFGRFTLL